VATRPAASRGGLGLTPDQALKLLESIEDVFDIIPETAAIYAHWRHLVVSLGVSGRQAHDARLAAVMQAAGIDHILTGNTKDFERYKWLTALHPNQV
jgi:predicted nucleic acid-binding protein